MLSVSMCFTVESYEPEPYHVSDSHTSICFHPISLQSDLV